MSSGPTRSINELLAEARQLVGTRPALTDTVEKQALAWKEQLASHPPTNDREREHYRNKAAEFRHLARAQLDSVSQVGTMIGELTSRLGELSGPEQAAVLRDQLGPVLGNEAKTVNAVASVLEVCILIDSLT
jgi:hypothetical protein